jgi:signal transduction histidine kinase
MQLASTHTADARRREGMAARLQPRSLQTLVLLLALLGALNLLLAAYHGAAAWALPAAAALLGVAALLLHRLQRLTTVLAQREHALEVEQRKVFHQEKMAAVGAMAAGVLHDIGNPIAAIDGVARAMKEAHASGECVPGDGLCDPELILRETARLQGFTRMIAGLAATQSTEPQLLNLNDIVNTAVLLLHFDPRLAGVRIDTALDAQLPAIHGVSDSLLQLVMNLLVNAADAVRARPGTPGLIHIKTAADGDGVRLAVDDNGCGMNEDTLRRAFEPMFTTKPAGLGTGLGLPLVRAIAEQHGGHVQLASAPGQGTQAQVRLAAYAPALLA